MSAQYTAVLDACVLHSSVTRDILLELAKRDVFQARWSEKILDEMCHSLAKRFPRLTEEKCDHLRGLMNKSTRDCLVIDFEPLIEGVVGLKDENDRHVVAAALQARAHMIVTWNLRDFPKKALERYRLEVLNPDDFLLAQFDLSAAQFLESVRTIRARLKNPQPSAEAYLEKMSRDKLSKTAAKLRDWITFI